jgi:hypothetical protein
MRQHPAQTPCLGERVSALADGSLRDDVRDRALAHTLTCPACRDALDVERLTLERLRTLPDVEPSARLMTALLALGETGGPVRPRRGAGPGMPLPVPVSLGPAATCTAPPSRGRRTSHSSHAGRRGRRCDRRRVRRGRCAHVGGERGTHPADHSRPGSAPDPERWCPRGSHGPAPADVPAGRVRPRCRGDEWYLAAVGLERSERREPGDRGHGERGGQRRAAAGGAHGCARGAAPLTDERRAGRRTAPPGARAVGPDAAGSSQTHVVVRRRAAGGDPR